MRYQLYPHIIAVPDIHAGKPVIAGTQVLGRTLIEQIAAAEVGGAEEGITAEKTTKPFFRVTTLRVVSVRR